MEKKAVPVPLITREEQINRSFVRVEKFLTDPQKVKKTETLKNLVDAIATYEAGKYYEGCIIAFNALKLNREEKQRNTARSNQVKKWIRDLIPPFIMYQQKKVAC